MSARIAHIPKRQLGRNGPWVSAMGLGTMGKSSYSGSSTRHRNSSVGKGAGIWYGPTDEKKALDTLSYAAERGLTFWDTADIYGTCM